MHRSHVFVTLLLFAQTFDNILFVTYSVRTQGTYITSPTTSARSFITTSADKFTSFSKTGQWGKALYGDFVAPSLQVCAHAPNQLYRVDFRALPVFVEDTVHDLALRHYSRNRIFSCR
jgi:hypothetical protein